MEDNKLARISAYAEITSSVAVLITLVYLAIQTHQISEQTELNTAAILASARQESLAAELDVIDMAMGLSDNPFFREVQGTRQYQEEDLAEAKDRFEAGFYYIAFYRARENLWLQYQNGVLDETTWLTFQMPMVQNLKLGGFPKTFWDNFAARDLNPDFVAEINALIEATEAN